MHSFDRTMLARLGFDDPDKKDRRHDLACQYVAQPHIANFIITAVRSGLFSVGIAWQKTLRAANGGNVQAQESLRRAVLGKDKSLQSPSSVGVMSSAKIEMHIQKGAGQYATTIGFADVALEYAETRLAYIPDPGACVEKWNRTPNERVHFANFKFHENAQSYSTLLVEVKIHPVSVGDIIRQLNLYRAYMAFEGTVALCLFPLQTPDIDALASANIHYMKLGPRFDEYVLARNNEQVSTKISYPEV